MFPVINLSLKFDANIFISDRGMWLFYYTLLIWLRNAFSSQFWGGFWGLTPWM